MPRKSWFRLSKLPPPTSPASPLPEPSQPTDQSDPYRPIQWSPNRLATLYVTPSERNLYLAAMSQLDQSPPPLPLWAEPPPMLPNVNPSPPLEYRPPPSAFPASTASVKGMTAQMRALSPKLVTSPEALRANGLNVRDEFRRVSPRTAQFAFVALTTPATLKFTGFPADTLVAVDEAVVETWPLGVLGRSESVESLRRRSRGNGGAGAWRIELEGRAWKRQGHSELDSIRLIIALLTVLGTYGWTLVHGVAAAGTKRDAHNLLFEYSAETQMLPPAFFALSIPLPDRISLISPPPKSTPALISSIRAAIVSNSSPTAPGKYPPRAHARSGTTNTGMTVASSHTASSARNGMAGGVTWNKWKGGIKLEGWVHPGVYRFWMGGMRRWFGGGVKRAIVDNLHPQLLLSIITALSTQHFALAASLPLQPTSAGRDVLIFSSLPASGVTWKDNYALHPEALGHASARSESPVLVSPLAASPVPDGLLDGQRGGFLPVPTRGQGRTVPWASTIIDTPTPQNTMDPRAGAPDGVEFCNPADVGGMGAAASSAQERKRNPSTESGQPLIFPPTATSSPRKQNILLKKSSVRRSVSGGTSLRQGALPESSAAAAALGTSGRKDNSNDVETVELAGEGGQDTQGSQGAGAPEREWSLVDAPPHVGHLGMTIYDPSSMQTPKSTNKATVPQPLAERPADMQISATTSPSRDIVAIPIPVPPPRPSIYPREQPVRISHEGPRRSFDASDSGASVYEDAPYQDSSSGAPALGLGSLGGPLLLPLAQHDSPTPGHAGGNAEQGGVAPLRSPKSPSRGRAEVVDVGSGIGVHSVAGSVGYLPSTTTRGEGYTPPETQPVEGLRGPSGSAGPGPQRDGEGDGRERRKIWDEHTGRWTEVEDSVPIEWTGPAVGAARIGTGAAVGATGGHAAGIGSGRTRVSVNSGSGLT